ncbi:hypothetical protein K7640_04985 [Micromonospora sp. PLK6-60]|uniref:hypothetical protein n=1 Tax=Micromonospora sp. PLK6-60 TaxID=2873383 RepID=UPI001CA768A0|nr:hypothetical protein [Micromonospora sp. PLK6-60]MBY8871200.1 hypothetical protein [Micromonospora sp. PLK6-60]
MSSPPVDPWSRQPEHPTTPGQYPDPTAPGGWPAVPGPRAGEQPTAAYPAVPHPGEQPTTAYPVAPTSGHPQQGPGAPAWGPPQGAPPAGSWGAPQGGWGPPPAGAQPTTPYGMAPGGFPPAPPAKKSSLPLVLSLSLVGLLVLCLGGGGLAYVALSGDEQDTPSARPTPTGTAAPETAAPSPSATDDEEPEATEKFPRVRLVTPKTLSGRAKSTDPELRALAAEMLGDMKSTVQNETGAVSAFYGSPEKRNLVMVAAASGLILDPEKELDDAVEGFRTELSVEKMTPVPPGPLGGRASCGDGEGSDVPIGVCVWADTGSVGVLLFFFSSAAKAKAQFVKVRGQIEKQS